MAENAYLKIDGIPGDSTSKQGFVDVMSFSFGAERHHVIGQGSAGGETGSGRANLSNLVVMKYVDKTSPLLFETLVTGKILKTVDLFYDKSVGNKQDDYYKIHLEHVVITSLQKSGSQEHPSESVSFAFGKVKVSYNPEKDGKLGGWIEKGYDLNKLGTW
jgi:type VI secretion system secreted protein Hcp